MSIGLSAHTTAVFEPAREPSGNRADRPARSSLITKSGRLRQIDALRVLSCFSVIAVHALGAPFTLESVGFGQTSYVLHYSREIFFFVSALVLVRTYYPRLGPDGRLPDESAFRRRRLRLIGIPYLWWTTIYLVVAIYHARHIEPFGVVMDDLPVRWMFLVMTGSGSYHMYFLLVTIQFGVAFPLVLRWLRRTEGRHGRVLAGSAVLQLATLACYHWVLLPGNGWRGLLGDASLLAYQFWLVSGMIVGLHLERWHNWIVRHRLLVLAALPVSAVVLMWSFWAQLPTRGPVWSSSPLQPMMMLWAIVVLGALYLAAVTIMERGSPRVRAIFSYGAQLSFGVYLAHPLVLDVVLSASHRLGVFSSSVTMSCIFLVLTTVLTAALCAALHRTRLSLPLMGRATLDPAKAPQFRLSRPNPRTLAGPAAFLVVSLFVLLLIGGDQKPATPGVIEPAAAPVISEASDAEPPSGDGGCVLGVVPVPCADPLPPERLEPMAAELRPETPKNLGE